MFHAPLPVLIIFGSVLIATAIWILGLIVSFLAAPLIAIYEDLFGYNSHRASRA